MTKTEILSTAKIVVLSLVLVLGISYVSAWTAPTATPPAGNVAAPINTSGNPQLKNGPLGVNGYFTAYSGMSANNNLIKEVATPIDGTDAVNKDYVDAATGGGAPCGYRVYNYGVPSSAIAYPASGGCQNQCVAHAVSNAASGVSALQQTIIFQCYSN